MAFRRRRMDWVVPESFGTQVQLTTTFPMTTFVSIRLVGSPDANKQALRAAAGGEYQSDIPQVDSNFTVLRIVGSLELQYSASAGGGTFWFIERIHTGLLDMDTPNSVAFGVDSLFDLDDAEEGFVWQRGRTMLLPAGTAVPVTDPNTAHPFYNQVDIRVKRRMQSTEGLYYSAQVAQIAGSGDLDLLALNHTLRLLCRT